MASWLVSVRGRVTVGVTVVFALAMVFGTWFLLNRAEDAWIEDLRAQDLDELEMIAQDLLAMQAIDAMLSGGVVLPVGEGGTSFMLTDETGALVGSTPQGVFGGVVVVEGPVLAGEIPEFILEGPPGSLQPVGDITTVSLPVDLEEGTLMITASSSLEPVRAGVGALRGILLVIVPLLISGVGAMAWFVTGRAFSPVEDITSQVERITDDRLDERVPVPDSRDEVAHLATTMNSMLDRLAASRTRQREFVSDASHELRSPVAASKTKLEVGLAHPDQTNWEETARVVLEEQDRLGGLIDDMLMLARLDEGRTPKPVDVDLDDVVFAEAERPYGVTVDVSKVTPVRVNGDAQQLARLVRNLVSNAVRHASSEVRISLGAVSDEAVLCVADDGPGIPVPDRDRIFERFVRLEHSRTRDDGGAGLGLALVAAVAAAHNGSVTVSEGTSRGASFELRMPVAL
ncbi:MAG: sensor histidine kinase [Acidimicrobiales bacterium]